MILPWAQLEPALQALFRRISNLPGTAAPSAATGVKAVTGQQSDIKIAPNRQQVDIEFTIVSDVPVGQAELREHYDEDVPYPGDTFEPDPEDPAARLGTIIDEVYQNHVVTLQAVFASGYQKTNAYDYASAVRARLHLPSAREELRAMGLALAKVGPVQGPIPELDPNMRAVGKYAIELVCNGMTYAIDAPLTTIETADITTELDT